MTVAIRSPNLLGALIPVDNAPVDASLKSDFLRYLEGLQDIQNAGVKRQAEADQILSKYEDVRDAPRAERDVELILRFYGLGTANPAIPPDQPCKKASERPICSENSHPNTRLQLDSDGRFSLQRSSGSLL